MVQQSLKLVKNRLELDFNTSYVMVQPIDNSFAFIPFSDFNTSYVMVQQLSNSKPWNCLENFNTSYVMVQHPEQWRCTMVHAISIHLMLWFNQSVATQRNYNFKFQYILCYGSTLFHKKNTGGILKFQYILCYGSTVNKMEN